MAPSSGGAIDTFIYQTARWLSGLPCSTSGPDEVLATGLTMGGELFLSDGDVAVGSDVVMSTTNKDMQSPCATPAGVAGTMTPVAYLEATCADSGPKSHEAATKQQRCGQLQKFEEQAPRQRGGQLYQLNDQKDIIEKSIPVKVEGITAPILQGGEFVAAAGLMDAVSTIDALVTFAVDGASPGAYAGITELAALCDLWHFKAIVYARAQSKAFAIGNRWADTTFCFWLDKHHLEYLSPVDGDYPVTLTQVYDEPVNGMLVGGGNVHPDGNLLDGLGLREMIRELVINEVRAAIKAIFADLGGGSNILAGLLGPAISTSTLSSATPTATPTRTVRLAEDGPATTKGNKGHKGDDAAGGGRPKGTGKGKGATNNGHDSNGPWITVTSRKPHEDEPASLRQQDWNDPVILYECLAAKLEASAQNQPFRAVIQCKPHEVESAKLLIQGSGREYSALLIEFDRDRKRSNKDAKSEDSPNLRQRIPVKSGNFIKFMPGRVHQIQSSGVEPSKPKHLTVAEKLPTKATQVLFCKIPQEFVSADDWRKFVTGPRAAIAKWAAGHHVHIIDTFSWTEEKLPFNRRQVFGIIRIAESDTNTLLGVSGAGGVFTQELMDLQSEVFRLAVATLQILTSGHHSSNSSSVIFKGTCQRGNEVDLVPIVITLSDEDTVTAWAKIAPPREAKVRQRAIKGSSMPCVTRPSVLDPITVTKEIPNPQGEQSDSGAAQGETASDQKKEVSAPKRRVVLQRQAPEGTTIVAQEKDGNCLYRTIATALNQSKPKADFHHLELRARVAAHLQNHPELYKKDWEDDGKKGADGVKCDSWDVFLQQVAKPGSYSGDIELRALCRLVQFRAILVPEDPAFAVVAYGKKWKSNTHCIFYSERHFDYLKPSSKGYPAELLSVTADPNGGFLVGGTSELHTAYTSSASSHKSSRCGGGVAALRTAYTSSGSGLNTLQAQSSKRNFAASSCAASAFGDGEECGDMPSSSGDGGPPPKRAPTKLPNNGLYKCPLCPFTRIAKTTQRYSGIRYDHCMKFHDGRGLPGRAQKFPVISTVQPRLEYKWKCKFCDCGILASVATKLHRNTLKAARRAHRDSKHPRISKERWNQAIKPSGANRTTAEKHLRRCRSLNVEASKRCKDDLVHINDGHIKFTWPMAKVSAKSSRIIGISLRSSWRCGKCGLAMRPQAFRKHQKSNALKCEPSVARKHAVDKLRALRVLRKWGEKNMSRHAIPEELFRQVFDRAAEALTVPDVF
ncbi:L96 [Symbiodinium sp. KB8]|nr:L96 [Symbiodinium sp. KB8]